MVKVVFTNIGKNFSETLQIEDLAVKNVFLFYYVHIFVKKKSEFVSKIFFMNGGKKLKKKHFVEKSFSEFEGAPLSPSNTLWLFSAKCFSFFLNIHKNCILYQFKIFSQKYARNKKKEIFDSKVFKLQCWWKKHYFGGVINPKTNFNHELGSKFFFLSDLAYKFVNLLVLKNVHVKWARTEL